MATESMSVESPANNNGEAQAAGKEDHGITSDGDHSNMDVPAELGQAHPLTQLLSPGSAPRDIPSESQPPKRKGGRKPIYATSEERKQRNRQAQAAFRERRTEYIKQLEETIRIHESNLHNLQGAHRAAAEEVLMLRYKNSLLERILLEKGIDVHAELLSKTGSPSLGPAHPQALEAPPMAPPPMIRPIMNRGPRATMLGMSGMGQTEAPIGAGRPIKIEMGDRPLITPISEGSGSGHPGFSPTENGLARHDSISSAPLHAMRINSIGGDHGSFSEGESAMLAHNSVSGGPRPAIRHAESDGEDHRYFANRGEMLMRQGNIAGISRQVIAMQGNHMDSDSEDMRARQRSISGANPQAMPTADRRIDSDSDDHRFFGDRDEMLMRQKVPRHAVAGALRRVEGTRDASGPGDDGLYPMSFDPLDAAYEMPNALTRQNSMSSIPRQPMGPPARRVDAMAADHGSFSEGEGLMMMRQKGHNAAAAHRAEQAAQTRGAADGTLYPDSFDPLDDAYEMPDAMDDSEIETAAQYQGAFTTDAPNGAVPATSGGQTRQGAGQYQSINAALNENLDWDPFGLTASMAFPSSQFAFTQAQPQAPVRGNM